MEYNTQRPDLVLPEYGRHVHKMVDYLKTIHDMDLRNQMAKTLIEIMGHMNPHLRDVPDFKHKLWDHLAIMADFDLDIDWPYPLPDREERSKPPDMLSYSDSDFGFKHYGKNLQHMLDVLSEGEYDEDTQLMLLKQLANHMKKSYVNWKKESVNDDVIFDDIEKITGGKIKIPRDKVTLADVKQPKPTQHKFQNKNNKRRKKSKRY
ncbi:MAG: DUF4290 domain-containing protein [Bacteroidota bacterium]|nr:DUF4290 domain-containing protein [Bacteroidota bacterium]